MTAIFLVILGLSAGVILGYYISTFSKSSKKDQIAMVKGILLYLVALAEKELGSKTGSLKLSQVYNEFVSKYPDLANVITYDEFKELVDSILEEFKDILNDKDKLNSLVDHIDK